MPCWYFDRRELRHSVSIQDGLTYEQETQYRREGARFILQVGTKMGLRYETMATGVVYFHRFYMVHTFQQFPRHVTACCCLFLAGKVEETPKKCRDIMKTAKSYMSEASWAEFGADPREEVMTLERILLQTIKFDFIVEHPYSYLLKYAKCLKGDEKKLQNMVQMAWTFVNDSLCTTLSLQWEPEIIAIALMYLAGKLSKFEVVDWIGRTPKQTRWWDLYVEGISMELLEDICHQVLDLYSSNNKADPNAKEAPTEKTPKPKSETPTKKSTTSSNSSHKSTTPSKSGPPPAKKAKKEEVKKSPTKTTEAPPTTTASAPPSYSYPYNYQNYPANYPPAPSGSASAGPPPTAPPPAGYSYPYPPVTTQPPPASAPPPPIYGGPPPTRYPPPTHSSASQPGRPPSNMYATPPPSQPLSYGPPPAGPNTHYPPSGHPNPHYPPQNPYIGPGPSSSSVPPTSAPPGSYPPSHNSQHGSRGPPPPSSYSHPSYPPSGNRPYYPPMNS